MIKKELTVVMLMCSGLMVMMLWCQNSAPCNQQSSSDEDFLATNIVLFTTACVWIYSTSHQVRFDIKSFCVGWGHTF